VKKWEEEWEKKWEEVKDRLEEFEKVLEKVEKRLEEREDERGREEETRTSEGSSGERIRNEGGKGSSREGSRYGSTGTIWSEDRLSIKEIKKVRRWVNEREREERKDNIVIRRASMPEEVAGKRKKRIEWVRELLRSKLGVECEVSEARKSGPVIVARIVGEERKKEVMRNKFKLKGGRIFIENDLSFEERKVQEKMSKWAKGKRNEGKEIKVGRGRVKISGKWIAWKEIEREEREGKEEEPGRRAEGGKGEQNFG